MDPASAFSLACGVVQLTELGCKLAIGAKELYQKGSLERYEEIEEKISRLRDLQSRVKSRRLSSPWPLSNADQQEDQDLATIAEKCDSTTEKLLLELHKLKMPESRNIIRAMGTSIKAMRRASKLEGLQQEIQSYQEVLNNRILISLRRKMNDNNFEQTEGFKRMNEDMRTMAIEFKDNHYTSVDQLNRLLQQGEMIIQRIDMNYRQQREEAEQAKEELLRKDFLKNLTFPDMFRREDEIKPAHKETFRWIFDSPGANTQPWNDLIQWLRAQAGTYWINGKAGSGKSTLMHLICQNSRTEDALRIWANQRELLRPSFFFWAAGSKLQQSVEGFLRSVICQLLDKHEYLIPLLSRSSQRLKGAGATMFDWTETRLLKCLETLISELSDSCSICLFADGLDEFNGEYDRLIKLIKKLARNSYFKCCFSSRPEKEFEREFKSSSRLQLQDLTRQDIQRYVEDKLGQFSQLRYLPTGMEGIRQNCIETITERADGVFLWVKLVVQGQILGLKNGDPPELLLKRLQDMPRSVENIYRSMLEKIPEIYRTEAAWYLEMTLHRANREAFTTTQSSIDHICVAKFGLTENLHLSDALTANNIGSLCSEVYKRIKTTCGGLLNLVTFEVNKQQEFDMWLGWEPPNKRADDASRDWSKTKVQFCHRTAKDFMETSEEGQSFLRDYYTFFLHSTLLDAAIFLARMKLCRLDDLDKVDEYMQSYAELIMTFARDGKFDVDSDLQAVVAVMDYFDKQIQKLYQKFHPQQNGVHWCERWIIRPSLVGRENEEDEIYIGPVIGSPEHELFPFPVDCDPKDFLSVCAATANNWYVQETLKSACISPTKAEQLALCIMTSVHSAYDRTHVRYWTIIEWEQLDVLTRVLPLQVNPNIRAPTSIWQETLSFLYGCKGNLDRQTTIEQRDDEEYAKIINVFLNAGANPNQRFTWPIPADHSLRPILRIWFEVDFDNVPLLGHNREVEYSESPELNACNVQMNETPRRPPRVRFSSSLMSTDKPWSKDTITWETELCELWLEEGKCMSNRQVQDLNKMLRAELDMPTALEDDNPSRLIAEWFKTTLVDTCYMCQKILSLSLDGLKRVRNNSIHPEWSMDGEQVMDNMETSEED